MADATLHQPAQSINFNRSDLNAAITAALSKVTDACWTRAIYRAASHLAAGQFIYDGHQVILRSASSNRVYHIDTREPMHCTCPAHEKGLICWHVTAARLIVRAAEHHQAHPQPKKSFEQIQREADELFS